MPTYDEHEDSTDLGAPVELFRFDAPDAEYFYTSDFETRFVLGRSYIPQPIARSNVVTSNQGEGAQLEVTLPANLPLVRDFAFDYAPPENLSLTVYRFHEDDESTLVTYWKGDVTSIKISGNTVKILVPSVLTNAIASTLPGKVYQSPCNHVLYDDNCKAERASYLQTNFASSVQTTYVGLQNIVSDPGGYYTGGELIHSATGERRLITSSQSDRLGINYPFRSVKPGDAIEFVPGCDHNCTTCRVKFSNLENFGGFPFIPKKNVFKEGLK